jgi:5-methylcytosine-specific restriction endonuclease McrA
VTVKRAERLTGYEIRALPFERGQVTLGAFDGNELVLKASGRVEWTALKALVHRVYLLHSRISLQRHDWLCARCRSRRPLQIHHRKYRSHGGTHKVDNLEPVCWDCHRVIHEVERSQ